MNAIQSLISSNHTVRPAQSNFSTLAFLAAQNVSSTQRPSPVQVAPGYGQLYLGKPSQVCQQNVVGPTLTRNQVARLQAVPSRRPQNPLL